MTSETSDRCSSGATVANFHCVAALVATVALLVVSFSGSSRRDAVLHPPTACELASRESGGFFCEPDAMWRGRVARFVEQQRQQMVSVEVGLPFVLFQKNWEPNFACVQQARLGPPGDGGKWVCDPPTIRALYGGGGARRCIVYSVGSNNVFDFEVAVHASLPACEIHVFDFTVEAPNPPPYVTYHSVGLGATDAPPFSRLETIIFDLGHENEMIELLKIDCEGCEVDAVFTAVPPIKNVRQLLLEIHGSAVTAEQFHAFFRAMSAAGWVVTAKEPNTQYGLGSTIEYAFLKLAWDADALHAEVAKKWCTGGWTGLHDAAAYTQANTAVCKGWGQLTETQMPIPTPIP